MTEYANTIAAAVGKFNDGDVDGYITTLYAADAVFHGFPPSIPPNRDGIAEFFHALRAGLPDATITAQDLLTDGERVAVRFTLTGIHSGELLGAPGSGERVEVEGITILRFSDGKVVERWNRLDDLALHTQIGVIPAGAMS